MINIDQLVEVFECDWSIFVPHEIYLLLPTAGIIRTADSSGVVWSLWPRFGLLADSAARTAHRRARGNVQRIQRFPRWRRRRRRKKRRKMKKLPRLTMTRSTTMKSPISAIPKILWTISPMRVGYLFFPVPFASLEAMTFVHVRRQHFRENDKFCSFTRANTIFVRKKITKNCLSLYQISDRSQIHANVTRSRQIDLGTWHCGRFNL